MGTLTNFTRELGIRVDSAEQFDISRKGTVKNIFGDKGDFGKFSREHGNTNPLGTSI